MKRKGVFHFIDPLKLVVITALVLCIFITGEQAFAGEDILTSCDQEAGTKAIAITPGDSMAADTLDVTAYMPYREGRLHEKTQTYDLTENSKLSLVVPYYGRWVLDLTYKGNGRTVATDSVEVGVTAKAYNIAPLMSSAPVLIFSLKLLNGDIHSAGEDGAEIPSIVTLARDDQYNWEALPSCMYANPYIAGAGAAGMAQPSYKDAVCDYVEELTQLDPESHFTFFINDYHMSSMLPDMVYGTGLPDGSYTLVFLTDGGGVSYNTFREAYDNREDASVVHEQKKAEFRAMRESLRSGGSLTGEQIKSLYTYIYAIIDVEDDAQWWVIRKSKDTFGRMLDEEGSSYGITDMDFFQTMLSDSRITSNYINSLLSRVEAAGNADVLKNLYKFDDSVYDEIRAEGKKPMMILGTSYGVEYADAIDEYVRILKAYYGDEYAYIYKGHPGNIPSEARIDEMHKQGMKVVDASIAAELFLFFNPDTVIAGYPSTTFQATEGDKTAALFLVPKHEAYASTDDMWTVVKQYAFGADFFVSRVTKSGNRYIVGEAAQRTSRTVNPAAIKALSDIDAACDNYVKKHSDHEFYLLEFNGGQPHELALWDVNEQRLVYPEDFRDVPSEDPQNPEPTPITGVTLTMTSAVSYAGKALQPAVTVKSGKRTLIRGVDYTITYGNNVNVGTAVVTVRGKGNYTGIKTRTFRILPKGTSVIRLKAGKKSLYLKWRKQGMKMASQPVTGYQIQCSTSSSFKTGNKMVRIRGYGAVSRTIKKLSSNRTYYVRVRTYKTIGKTTYYSPWSGTKRIKVR